MKHGAGRWRGIPAEADLLRLLGTAPRYLSVGHTGLDARCLGAMSTLSGACCGVLLHDTIPIDLPRTQKAGAAERFRQKLRWVARAADKIYVPSEAVSADVTRHLSPLGFDGPPVVVPLGVRLPRPGDLPRGLPAGRPFFVVLGTIEPRKNHRLLLDLWEEIRHWPERPMLVIAGRRGWRNDALFERLDDLSGRGDVFELGDLPDPQVDALIAGARALLFPSRAEGYGFPPLEAARLGTPVVSSPLGPVRERLGDWAVYADPDDRYQWRQAVGALLRNGQVRPAPGLPDWKSHFNSVLSSLG